MGYRRIVKRSAAQFGPATPERSECPANLIGREAPLHLGIVAACMHINGARSIGWTTMRPALAFGLLIALCSSASAETVHHFRKSHHVTIQPSQGMCVPPSCYKFPGYPPLPPEAIRTHDPSTFGGG